MFRAVGQFCHHVWCCVLAYYIAAVYVVQERLGRKFGMYRGLRDKELRKQQGRVAIVTGGSRGIGLEIVHTLLEYGYTVIIGSSSAIEARTALENSLKTKYPQASVEVWSLDLASLHSVKKFADDFLLLGKPLHLLINNAGIMFVPLEITNEGFERHFVVNYLSHCLLTALLLPRLQESATKDYKSRIINSTSCIHFVGNIDLADLHARFSYSKYHAYMQSKLAQVMFTYSLQSHLDAQSSYVTVNCAHPGVVNTDLMSSVWWTSYVGSAFFKTASEGAETAIYAALSTELEGVGGKYLEECAIVPSSKKSQDIDTQVELWKETWNLLKPWLNDVQNSQLLSGLSKA